MIVYLFSFVLMMMMLYFGSNFLFLCVNLILGVFLDVCVVC